MNIDALRKAHPLIGELIKAYDSLEKCPSELTSQEWDKVVKVRIDTRDEKLRSLGIVAAVHKPDAFLRDVKHTPNPNESYLAYPAFPTS